MQSYEAILRARGLGGSSLPSEVVHGGDLYAERMQAALDAINRPDYPTGMIPWLGKSHPDLYRELTEILPEQIHYLWSTRAALDEFEQVLQRLVETHRLACQLYREQRLSQ